MISKKELAIQNFKNGYNCCQSVLLAFAEEFNVDKNTLKLIASSFGGGVGRMREICGAVSGMCMVAGLAYGYIDPLEIDKKSQLYKKIQAMAIEFKNINGSIICRELLHNPDNSPIPDKRDNDYYKKRPCAELVGDAATIVEKILGHD